MKSFAMHSIAESIVKGDKSCESVVLETLKNGISGGELDVLQRARELDKNSALGAKLFGVPLFMGMDRVENSVYQKLAGEGALIFKDTEVAAIGNPRDCQFPIGAGSTRGTAAVNAVARGNVKAAVLSSPVDDLMPQSLAWTGLTGIRLPAAESVDTVLCGTSMNDLLLMRGILSGISHPLRAYSANSLPLDGIKITYIEDWALTDMSAPVELSVSHAVSVAIAVLENMGASCTAIKTRGREQSLEQMLREPQCHVFISPATRSAALPLSEEKQAPQPLGGVALSLSSNLAVSFPVGLVAGDDDGYDSDTNDERWREGLPINMVAVAIQDDSRCTEACLEVARCYENASRWASEVFAAGATREAAQEDMDDAREVYGVYFATSLLRFMGRKASK